MAQNKVSSQTNPPHQGIYYFDNLYVSSGSHLLTKDASSGTIVLPRSLSASVQAPLGTDLALSTYSQLSYLVQIDNRAVTIVGGRATTKKVLLGGVDANGDGLWQSKLNSFDATGTLSDDIAIPYGEKHNEVISGALVPVDSTSHIDATYFPNFLGNWATEASRYLENSSAKNYNLQGILGDYSDPLPTAADIPKIKNTFVGPTVDDTNNSAILWNDAGMTDRVFFKYTNGDNRLVIPTPRPTGNDGDGAIASANYYLHIHRPLETFPSHKKGEDVYRIATAYPVSGIDPLTGQADIPMSIDSPGYATYGTDGTNGAAINVHLNDPSVSWDLSINTFSGLGSVPFPGQLAILDTVFITAGILVNYYKPVAETHPVAFSEGAWADPWSTGQGTGLKKDYHMFPRFRVRYHRTYILVDSYDMSGFLMEKLTYSDKFVDNFSSFGYFQYVGNNR